MSQTYTLSPAQIHQFEADGFLLIKDFYDLKGEILPIQKSIYDIICLIAADHAPGLELPPFSPATFDAGYQRLIARDRRLGGMVYDAAKQLPAFMRLLASEKHEAVLRQLRKSNAPGIAAGGYGMRIDNPGESRFNSIWHNDYFSQLRSRSGVVFWASLVDLTPEMGPVILCKGSHQEPLIRFRQVLPDQKLGTGSYQEISNSFHIHELERLMARYPQVTPVPAAGDLLLIDFLTIHTSGNNVSQRSRWTMQMRWFAFDDESGRKIKWVGSFAAGTDFREIHPEMIAHD